MNVMILCAGTGSRLRPWTLKTPKPAIPFLGVPLAVYPLMAMDRIKIKNLVVNTHYLPEQIEQLFWKINWPCQRLIFSHEKVLLGSGGAVHNAHAFLKDSKNFILANGDEVLLPYSLGLFEDLIHTHERDQNLATLLVIKHPGVGTKFGGCFVDPQMQIKKFSKTLIPGFEAFHYTGFCILSQKVFNYFKTEIVEENILFETLTLAIQQGESVAAFHGSCDWFEVGSPQDFTEAELSLIQRLASFNPDSPFALQHLQRCTTIVQGQTSES